MKNTQDIEKEKPKSEQHSPPISGIAIAGAMWIWGALIIFAPTYLGIIGGWQYIFLVPGFLLLIISLGGTILEIGKLRQSEGLSHWGISIVFIFPAIILQLSMHFGKITGIFIIFAKIAVLLFSALGVTFIFAGLSHFFGKNETPPKTEIPQESKISNKKNEKSKPTFEMILNILIAMLALATAIITLVGKIIP